MSAGAPEFWFYHLERSNVRAALPQLLELTVKKGLRALVRVRDERALAELDDGLWTYRDEAFLPHGRVDAPNADRQPVLITTGTENANAAHMVFLLDETDAPENLAGVERCCVMFDGRDPDALKAARAAWKAAKAQGRNLAYWKQKNTGGWSREA